MVTDDIPCIGVDFGTSKCVMTWFDSRTNRAEILRNAEGDDVTPSLVYIGEDETLVGRYAKEMLDQEGARANVIASVKSELSSKKRYGVPGSPTPINVAAQIFKKLKGDAENGHFHESVQHVVVTHPADFDEIECERLAEAAQEAGFQEVELLPEPVSAAVSYARTGLRVGDTVMVYDLGAGTFDLALLSQDEEERGGFRVALPPMGLRYGGDNLDRALYDHCERIAQQTLERPIALDGTLDLKFLMDCRARKENLSNRDRVTFSSYLQAEDGSPLPFRHEILRNDFERLIVDELEGTVRATRELLAKAADAKLSPSAILLVGGSSRVPLVGRLLQEALPLSPLEWEKRDVAVALGAAYHAYALWNGTKTGRGAAGATTTRRQRKRAELTGDQLTQLSQSLAAATAAYRGGRFAEAVPLLEAVQALDPQNEAMLQMLGASFSMSGNPSGGIRIFQQLIRAYNDNAYYQQNLGKALEMANRPDEAVTAYQASVRLNSNTRAPADLVDLLGRLAQERGRASVEKLFSSASPLMKDSAKPEVKSLTPVGKPVAPATPAAPTLPGVTLNTGDAPLPPIQRTNALPIVASDVNTSSNAKPSTISLMTILLQITVPAVAESGNVFMPLRCFVNEHLVGSGQFSNGLTTAVRLHPGKYEIRVEGRKQTRRCALTLKEPGISCRLEIPFHWSSNTFGEPIIQSGTT